MVEMQSKSDAQLLREYAEHGAEAAFAEIVSRHTNLVYSAALRQVDSPDLAAEVAQSVFIDLARGARSLFPQLTEDASLAGWLCRCARNIALNLRRDEFRRHSRERLAMEDLDFKFQNGAGLGKPASSARRRHVRTRRNRLRRAGDAVFQKSGSPLRWPGPW